MMGKALTGDRSVLVAGAGPGVAGAGLAFGCGLVSLAFQTVWARWVGLHLGQEVLAGCGALAGTMLGMALGAWGYARLQGRWLKPFAWFLALQALKTVGLAMAAVLLPYAGAAAAGIVGVDVPGGARWVLALMIPALACLPVTLVGGAEWAALAAWRGAVFPGGGGQLGSGLVRAAPGPIYAAHTAGACVGAWLSVAWLLPRFGFAPAVLGLCLANGLLLALAGLGRMREERTDDVGLGGAARVPGEDRGRRRVLLLLGVGGVLGMAFETVGMRALAQIFENTAFSFAAVVTAFLACNSLGAAVEGWWRVRTGLGSGSAPPVEGRRLAAVGAGKVDDLEVSNSAGRDELVARGFYGLAVAVAVAGLVLQGLGSGDRAVGSSVSGVWMGVVEGFIALGVLGPAAALMGWVFARLARVLQERGGTVAAAAAASALGGAVGAGVGVLGLVPGLGIKGSLGVLCVAYLGLGWPIRGWVWAAVVGCGVGFWFVPDPLPGLRLPEGARATWFREGAGARVAVIEGSDRHRVLQVNNRFQMGGTAALVPQKRQAHVPLALHPRPRRALFIGPGTGITLAGAVEFPDLAIDAVELLDEVVAAMPQFEPQNAGVATHPAVRLRHADARRFVRGGGAGGAAAYDVVVCDLFHPALDGAGGLYTTDHFAALRATLAPGGLLCQWIPVYQFDERSLRLVVRSFLAVFPEAAAWLLQPGIDVPVIGLVGSVSPLPVTPRWLEGEREAAATLRLPWRAVGLQSTVALLGSCVAGAEGLTRFAGAGVLNTDAHPRLLFEPPVPERLEAGGPGRLLMQLVEAGRESAGAGFRLEAGEGGESEVREMAAAVAAYGRALEGYLRGLLAEQAGDVDGALERYLTAAQASVYFTPAYARCVTVIRLRAALDRESARAAYRRLLEVRPDQPLGRQMLGPLFEGESR